MDSNGYKIVDTEETLQKKNEEMKRKQGDICDKILVGGGGGLE